MRVHIFLLLLLALHACQKTEVPSSNKSKTSPPKVLLIGIDGCRPDALKLANTPNLDNLISVGAFNPQAQTCARTVSGPSWMSILTGVWPETHGVLDNSFEGYVGKPASHFLTRIEEFNPSYRTASITEWAPLSNLARPGADFVAAPKSTTEVANLAISELRANQPNVMFLHFDEVDHAGHSAGYGTNIPNYIQAIEHVDSEIGRVLDAMENLDDWLILATTDHGGTGTSHGKDIPLHRTVFLLASGNYKGGPKRWRRYAEVVDIVPTIFRHLKIPLKPEWNLTGVSLGMSGPNRPQPYTKSFIQTFDNSEASIEMVPINDGDYYLSKTEIPWEIFDLFFLRSSKEIEADGISGPSKSVFPVDRGYGHDGYPALGMTFNSAQHFCEWLSKETGREYRLPTEWEWMAGAKGARNGWSKSNSDGRPHPSGKLPAERNGLFDIVGNLAEWATDSSGKGVVCGGSFQDATISPQSRDRYDRSWQARDPQWPKSSWWMSDCGWVGIRVLCGSP
ncbi:MAG: alkaline phosphatase family protein [Planctomycetota bacterium]|nr:alkaline phosphatase family protein [Planctomycetota bacterium]MDP6940670.1 alkaline phosphatase family protein [Planctomycetota bacterium]